ncbi:MAG: AmmeMemoRadiSam system protein A [Alkalispirochaeta sp.]
MTPWNLSAATRCALLGYSRALLGWRLGSRYRHGQEPHLTLEDPILDETPGLFVTLRKYGELRGCIGTIRTSQPLRSTLRRVTLEAALEDPRFDPVTDDEIQLCVIEHSILTVPREVEGIGEINLGSDGIILSVAGKRALFLPEVSREQGWDLSTTLSHLARKAGLSSDAWRGEDARFEVFETVHYTEEECVNGR